MDTIGQIEFGEPSRGCIRAVQLSPPLHPLFNNVFVKPSERSYLSPAALPPFRFFLGDRVFFERIRGETDDNIYLGNTGYFIVAVAMPLLLCALAVALLVQLRSYLHLRRRLLAIA